MKWDKISNHYTTSKCPHILANLGKINWSERLKKLPKIKFRVMHLLNIEMPNDGCVNMRKKAYQDW